jgi:hypothetical protein
LRHATLLLIVDLAEIENGSLHRFVGSDAMIFYNAEVAVIFTVFYAMVLRRNMLTEARQKSRGKGKTLGLHSTVFSELEDGNTRLTYEHDGKNTENCLQLRKFG